MQALLRRSPAVRRAWMAVKRATGPWLAPILNAALRLTARRAGVVIVYHVIDRGTGDRETELVPAISDSDFGLQLDHLSRYYEVVRARDLPEAVRSRRRGRRFPVGLSFDDDTAQHLRHASPALAERGLPATFFLCGNLLEGRQSMWWQRLQRAFDRGLVSSAPLEGLGGLDLDPSTGSDPDIHRLGASIERLDPERRDRAAESLLAVAGPDPDDQSLDAGGIRTLARQGFEIGFHTRRHDPLIALDDEALGAAMVEGREELSELAGQPMRSIAYPHGYADRRVADAARRAGFELGFTGERQAYTPRTDPLLIGRADPIGFGPSRGAFALGVVRTLVSTHLGGPR